MSKIKFVGIIRECFGGYCYFNTSTKTPTIFKLTNSSWLKTISLYFFKKDKGFKEISLCRQLSCPISFIL